MNLQPWFAALDVPIDGPYDIDMDAEGEWIVQWNVPGDVEIDAPL
jgi:hypothetical protein